MRFINLYSSEIHEFVKQLRSEKYHWDDIATKVNDKFNSKYSKESIRKAFDRQNKRLEENTDRIDLLTRVQDTWQKDDWVEFRPELLLDYHHFKSEGVIIEILFSDWQIGKLINSNFSSDQYNTEIALTRFEQYSAEIINFLKGYDKIDKIIFASLGDIIESSNKALKKSHSMSCDIPTTVQIQLSIEQIFKKFLLPLSEATGRSIPIEVIAITGNHDHDESGMLTFNPGEDQFSYVIYKSLELLCEQAGLKQIRFIIPKGNYLVNPVWKRNHVLYEHGYNYITRYDNLSRELFRRERQVQKYIKFMRVGDKHSLISFNNYEIVVNGAFFADRQGTEYSGGKGFCSDPCQLTLVYDTETEEILNTYVVRFK